MRPGPPLVVLVLMLAACSTSTGHRAAPSAPSAPANSTAAGAATTIAGAAPTTVAAPSTIAGHPPSPPVTGASSPPPGAIGWTVGPWVGAGRIVNGSPAVFTTTLTPSTGGALLGAARLDPSRLRFALYAGTRDPGGGWTNAGAVPASLWPALVATFNSGFQLKAARGGFYADGHSAPALPLRDGAASFVIFQDGSATVAAWGRDVQLSANVVAVRQNLELLVDGGRPAANVATNIQPNWGFTLNNSVVNWRSAVAVDAGGQILYVGGPGLDPAALATALISVGALRAMELDINPAWVTFTTFTGGPGPPTGTKLLAGMNPPAGRFLSGFARDFFAVFTR